VQRIDDKDCKYNCDIGSTMHLLDMHKTPGVLDRVVAFLGSGCELCLALASWETFIIVSRIMDRKNGNLLAQFLGKTSMMVFELKSVLSKRHLSLAGKKNELIIRMTGLGLTNRSVCYFMSTPSLCTFAESELGLTTTDMPYNLMNKAAAQGLIPGVQMLRRLVPPFPWDEDTVHNAAKGGQLEMLKWMRQPGKPEGVCAWDERACLNAAKGGHLHVLQWLRLPGKPEGQCPWSSDSCTMAALYGHLDVLKWLRDPFKAGGQCPWSPSTCAYAAFGGHLDILQWLRLPDMPRGRCPWAEGTCIMASQGGRLDVMKWLRSGDDPCPWNLAACYAVSSNSEMRNWIALQIPTM
jgi:hypothetical protein